MRSLSGGFPKMSARLPKNNSDLHQLLQPAAKKVPWRSLIWQLVFLTILPLTALVLLVAFGSLTVHQNAMRTLVGERDERSVRTAAAALEEQIKHRGFALLGLAQRADQTNDEDLASILTSSDYLMLEFDGGLAFFRPDGELEIENSGFALRSGLATVVSGRMRNQQPDGTEPLMYEVYFADESAEPIVLVLAYSPTRQWIAAGAFSAVELVSHTLADAFANGPGASVIVMDSEKRLLYEGGEFSYSGEISDHPGVAEALRGESGAQYLMVGKEEHVVAYSPIAPLGWALVLEEPWEMVESPILRTSQFAPLVLAPVLVLAIVALWFNSRQIVKPLQELEARAAMLAWGKFDAIEDPVGGVEEIRQLQSELIHMAHKVQSAQQSLHGYIGAITAAQEDERRRLARELHDDTIQALIALKQRVQLAQIAQNTESKADSLTEILSLTEQTIENLRRLTRALRPIYLEDLGLVTALEMLAREVGQASGIAVEFERQGPEKRLEPAAELALYRIAQEALSNIIRHSQATHATLSIRFTAQTVVMQVIDNGKGFDVPKSPAEFAPSGHYGLLGLYERADLIGAALEIQSANGKGTQLEVTMPLVHSGEPL